MASSSIVGSRELKTRLGQYLNRVRKGETLLVTDRHEPDEHGAHSDADRDRRDRRDIDIAADGPGRDQRGSEDEAELAHLPQPHRDLQRPGSDPRQSGEGQGDADLGDDDQAEEEPELGQPAPKIDRVDAASARLPN